MFLGPWHDSAEITWRTLSAWMFRQRPNDAQLRIALDSFDRGDIDEAHQIGVSLLEEDLDDHVALMVTVLAHLRSRNAAPARRAADQLLRLMPTHWVSQHVHAWVLIAENMGSDAVTAAVESAELVPGDVDAVASAAEVLAQVNGYRSQTREFAKRSLKLDGNCTSAQLTLAQLHCQRGDWARAIELFETAIAVEPDNHDARAQLAAAQKCAGQLDASKRTSVELAELAPKSRFLTDVEEKEALWSSLAFLSSVYKYAVVFFALLIAASFTKSTPLIVGLLVVGAAVILIKSASLRSTAT